MNHPAKRPAPTRMQVVRNSSILLMTMVLFSCSAVSKQMRTEAVDVPFETLAWDTEPYIGKTVILGGYIYDRRVHLGVTQLIILQAPLGLSDQPKSKKDSKGFFMALCAGDLDPEIYRVGQDVTVAGTVMGREIPDFGDIRKPMVQIRVREIHYWEYGHNEDRWYDVLQAVPSPGK